MGLRQLGLKRVANRFKRVFMDECKVSLYRSEKVFDEVGGDIEITHDKPIYIDLPCYFSQHPWYTTAVEDHPGYLNMRGNYRFHFFIEADIREGDILKVDLVEYPKLPAEQYLINKIAYYPTHIRCECGNGVCAGGVCDDGHEDDIQECHGDSALQDHLTDAKGRHADADVCRSHEIHDAPIW